MMKKLIYFLSLIFLSLILNISAFGQSVNLRVAQQVVQGQRFTLTIVITNGDANISRNDAPSLTGCTLLGGPGKSTMQSVQIANGRQTSSVSTEYTFTYLADKAGTVNIPSIKVNIDGNAMATPAKTLTILPPDQANQRNNSYPGYGSGFMSAMDEMDALMNELMGGSPATPRGRQQQATPPQTSKISPNDFIVTVNLSKNNLYEKEAVIATIKLYTKHDVTKFQPIVMPQFEGFLSEEIDISNQQPQQEHFRGENYYTLVLKKCLLYPQKSGRLTINSGTYDVTLQTVDYVTNGFYYTPVPKSHNITTTSNSLTVNVKPLPSPVPPSFNGAVGNFDVSATLEPSHLRTNEAARYTLTINGTGNLKHLTEPIINFPSSVEEYTPTGESNAKFNGSNMQGSYTAVYTFVPQQTGELRIDSWDYTFFNPSSGKYETITLPAISRDVTKGIPTAGTAQTTGIIDTAKIKDIRHITEIDENKLSFHVSPLFFKFSYWIIYLLGLIIFIASIIIYKRHIRLSADVEGQKTRKARSVAARRLRAARQALNSRNNEKFYEALSAAMYGFLSDKLKMPASELTRHNISEKLEKSGVQPETIAKTINLLDQCEMARFTPNMDENEKTDLYDSASYIINNVNRIKPVQQKVTQNAQSRYGIN